jgi:hypothetical protein
MTAPAQTPDTPASEFARAVRKATIAVTVGYDADGRVITAAYQIFAPGPRLPMPVKELVRALREHADVLEMAGPEAVL